MICSNCHNNTDNPTCQVTLNNVDFFPLCLYCVNNIPVKETKIGVKLYLKTTSTILAVENVIKYAPNLAKALQIPILDESAIKPLNAKQLKIWAEKWIQFAKEHPLQNNKDSYDFFKKATSQGLTIPLQFLNHIFTVMLTYDNKQWGFSIASPTLNILPQDFCNQIAEYFLTPPFKMFKANPTSPVTQFWT